jgi:hypothetical protein
MSMRFRNSIFIRGGARTCTCVHGLMDFGAWLRTRMNTEVFSDCRSDLMTIVQIGNTFVFGLLREISIRA